MAITRRLLYAPGLRNFVPKRSDIAEKCEIQDTTLPTIAYSTLLARSWLAYYALAATYVFPIL